MHAFHTIVVGIDPQATTGGQLRMAVALVRESSDVLSPVSSARVVLASCVTDESVASKAIDLQKRVAESAGVEVEHQAIVGAPCEALPSASEEVTADLLLIAARPASHPFRSRFGPVATRLACETRVPTLVFRPGRVGLEQTVAVTDDFEGDDALERLHLATEWALDRQCGLVAVHALDEDSHTSIERCESRLFDRLAETDFRSISSGVIPFVRNGTPATVIDQAVRQFDVDLLVTGRDCVHTLESLLPQIDCSLLVVSSQSATSTDSLA